MVKPTGRAPAPRAQNQQNGQKPAVVTKKSLPNKPPERHFDWATSLTTPEQARLQERIKELEVSRRKLEASYACFRNISDLPSPAAREAGRACQDCGITKKTFDTQKPTPTCTTHPSHRRNAEDSNHCDRCDSNVRQKPGCVFRPENTFSTPSVPQGMFVAPAPDGTKKRRALVVLDAEFVRVIYKNGSEDQVIGSIGMVRGLTGEVLLDHIVAQPKEKDIKHVNYKYSGLSQQIVNKAKETGTAIIGLGQMHRMLNQHIDADTIICGHAVHNDLTKMRLGVDRILDTQVLFHAKDSSLPGFKTLVQTKLVEKVIPCFQATESHDALEDAMATRELLLAKAFEGSTTEEEATIDKKVFQPQKV